MTEGPDALAAFVARTLDRPGPPEIAALAGQVAARPGVAAVLFYGNMLRDPRAGGLADLYALTDSDHAWGGPGPGAVVNRLLPPNVYHLRAAPAEVTSRRPSELGNPGHPSDVERNLRFREDDAEACGSPAAIAGAKLAVMRLASFRNRMRRESWDTTLWARFAQPAALLYARDEAARVAVVEAIATGWRTAAWWADRLAGSGTGEGGDRWEALFTATYSAELRPEGTTSRPVAITARAPELYAEIDRLLPPDSPSAAEAEGARREWRRRRRVGHALNAARLVKAATTFRGGAAYALSKIERHAGPGALRPWERRLPWLAAPLILLRLLRRGGLR